MKSTFYYRDIRHTADVLDAVPADGTEYTGTSAVIDYSEELYPAHFEDRSFNGRAFRIAATYPDGDKYEYYCMVPYPADRIDLCTINLNEGDGRQTIYYNPEDKRLYSDIDDEPVNEARYPSVDAAREAAAAIWDYYTWDLEWID